jgi:hypothetical protein
MFKSFVSLCLACIGLGVPIFINQIGLQSDVEANFNFNTQTAKNLQINTGINNFDKNSIKQKLEEQKNKISKLNIPLPPKPIIVKKEVVKKEVNETNISSYSQSPTNLSNEITDELIDKYCAEYNCNAETLKSVYRCESGGTNHVNTTYKGIFQFLPSTFAANANRIGMPDAYLFDEENQVKVAAYMFGKGQGTQWPHCYSKAPK